MKFGRRKFIGFSLLVVFALVLSACGGSSKEPTPTPVDPNLVAAQAIATFAMGLTQTAFAQPTATATLTLEPTATNTFAPLVTSTSAAAPTSSCYVGEFITDVTVPDGTVMAPGQAFDKIWRVKNIGTCPWLPTFTASYSYGSSQMNGVATPLGKTVNPGEQVDITVKMVAPNTAGDHNGAWFIRADNGQFFRLMTVQIKVVGAPAATGTVTATATPTETPTATP